MSFSPCEHLSGEPQAVELLGVATIGDRLVLRDELQELRTAVASQRQRRLSIESDSRRRSSQPIPHYQALDEHELRAELTLEFEKRLADMHVQLLAKQREFDAYRHAMEHDLNHQLRIAQSHLVGQLVDKSGAISVETKTRFLESLHEQGELERLQKENLLLKQTLLKLQTLHDMQRKIRDVESEKEKASQRRRTLQLANENAELQQRVKQLEMDLAKVTQERTLFHTKYTELHKHHELAAQRRREAKVRALSAPYRRRLDGLQEPGDTGDDRDQHPLDYDQQEDAFEKVNEVRIRSPRRDEAPVPKSADEMKTREEHHLQSMTRHYQNEIKRLQQQLTKEIKLKTQLLDQVTQLKDDYDNSIEDGSTQPSTSNQQPLPHSARLVASPRVRATSASVCSPRKAIKVPGMAPRRPGTSYSPRVQRPETGRLTPGYDTHTTPESRAQLASPIPSHSNLVPSRSFSASLTSRRKFEVHHCEPPVVKVGGVAGVQNALSARERLPYR